MPLMRLEASRSGSPTRRMSGSLGQHLLEHRLDLHLGERGAQAVVRAATAERDVLVGRARHVEAVRVGEDVLVAVGGAVPDGDLLTLLDRHAAQLGVDGRGAPEVHDRAHVAQHLVHERVQGAGHVGQDPRLLLRVLHQRQHPAADEVPGGLVARHREQQHEHVELDVGQLLAVELGGDERGDDVVHRALTARVGQRLRVHVELHRRFERLFRRALVVLGVGVADEAVRPLEDLVAVLVGHAEQLGDDDERELRREVRDEVDDVVVAELALHDLLGRLTDVGLHRLDHLGSEPVCHQVPQPCVLRRVLVEHHELGALLLVVEQCAALRGGEGLHVALDGDDVRVLRDDPEARCVVRACVPVHRLLAPEVVEEVVRWTRQIRGRVVELYGRRPSAPSLSSAEPSVTGRRADRRGCPRVRRPVDLERVHE